MGCRILRGTEYDGGPTKEVMYCSTTDWAFGPLMDEDEGEAFIRFVHERTGLDPRVVAPDNKLESLYYDFRKARGEGGAKCGYCACLRERHEIELPYPCMDCTDCPTYTLRPEPQGRGATMGVDLAKQRVRIGGVLRCCFEQDWPNEAKEGDVLDCRYCGDGLRFHDGAWQAKWIKVEADND